MQLNRPINFETKGEETELDKHMVDKLSGFTTHLIRNSIDHGIEEPALRTARGKPQAGSITVSAFIHGGYFYIEISDDGSGISRKRVLEKAIKNGIVKESDTLTDQEIVNLIFHPGLSTKDQASEISGRGFGMDIVQHEVSRMHGTISVDSVEEKFTKIAIRLPLTMAIFNGIVVRINDESFIVPSSEVQDISRIPEDKIIPVNERESLVELKGAIVPLIPMEKAINIFHSSSFSSRCKDYQNSLTESNTKVALEVMYKNKLFALQVDELVGIQRVVLKNLGKELKHLPGISGGTVLSDGGVALVVETEKIIELYEKQFH